MNEKKESSPTLKIALKDIGPVLDSSLKLFKDADNTFEYTMVHRYERWFILYLHNETQAASKVSLNKFLTTEERMGGNLGTKTMCCYLCNTLYPKAHCTKVYLKIFLSSTCLSQAILSERFRNTLVYF